MKRAVLMALGIGAILTSAAAFSINDPASAATLAHEQAADESPMAPLHAERRAREQQRAGIESQYQGERAKCAALGGIKRDNCLIAAHANRGRSLLAAAAPYETRY